MLFVDSLKPFSEINTTLLAVLRERFPSGLAKSHTSPETTPLPGRDETVRIAYALPVSPADLTQGWRDLKITGSETPAQKGLKDNCAVAFVVVPEDGDDAEFVVDVPNLDEAYEDDEL